MRKMYSLKQIEQIANSEVNKIIPKSSVSDENKVIQVGSNGKYKLATIEGATPVYWHGINLYTATPNQSANVYGHILNNTNTAIDTIAKFKAWIEGITGFVMFQCHGVAIIEGVKRDILTIFKQSDNSYGMTLAKEGDSDNAFENVYNVNLETLFAVCEDATNQVL